MAEVAAAEETVTMVSTAALPLATAVVVTAVVAAASAALEDSVPFAAGAAGIVSSLGTSTIRVNSLYEM